jgi:hypothetical protein
LSPEPPASVTAPQERFTWLQLTAVAVSPAGVGGGQPEVVALTAVLWEDSLPALSIADTPYE